MNKYSNDDIYHFTSNKPHRLSDPLVLDRRNSNRSSQQYVGSDLSTLSSAVDDLHIVSEHENTSNFDIVDSLDYDDIDDGLIDQEIQHRKREAFIQELHSTEKTYIKSLELITEFYINPLRKGTKQSSFNFLGMKKMVCTEREMRWLFGNIQDILSAHHEIISSLEKRLNIWGPTQIISDIVQTWFPFLKSYSSYFDNYDVMFTTYERLSRYQPFKKFSEALEKNSVLKGTTLMSLLKAPVSCIPRYTKLLTALADSTSPMHPDYSGLMQCKQRIQQINDELRPRIEDAKNVDQVLKIHEEMVGQPYSVKVQRRLLLREDFSKSTAKLNMDERIYFLFSDILVFARVKQSALHYKGHLTLERARIRALSSEETDGNNEWSIEITSSFQGVDTLNTTFMGSPTVHVMHFSNKEDQARWIKYLEVVVDKLAQTAVHNKVAVSKSSSSSAARNELSISSESSTSNSFKSSKSN